MYLDNDRLAKYGLSDQVVAATLFQKGFTTTGGRGKDAAYTKPIHVEKSLNSVYDIEQQIVYSAPDGTNVRLKDIATVKSHHQQWQEMSLAECGDEERSEHREDGRGHQQGNG